MVCEACQAKEAANHLTNQIGVPPIELEAHLCVECAIVYQEEFVRFLQQERLPISSGMSKADRQAVYRAHGETVKAHMDEWKRKSSSR